MQLLRLQQEERGQQATGSAERAARGPAEDFAGSEAGAGGASSAAARSELGGGGGRARSGGGAGASRPGPERTALAEPGRKGGIEG